MRMVFAALVAGQSMIFGLAASISPPTGTARTIVHAALALSALAVFFLVGLPILREALAALRKRKIVIEQLFLAGIAGAFFASLHCSLTGTGHIYYEVVAILVTIYTLGKILGERRRQSAIAEALRIGLEFSRCRKITPDGAELQTHVSEISPGDLVRVPRGEGIPIDGTVAQGTAFVRESALTGETFPVVKRPGDPVLAGSICLDDALLIRATAPGSKRLLDSLLESVRKAQATRSRIQHEADRIVAWFLPTVLTIATATFLFWLAISTWERALFNALAVLVVACPCSMGLATPIGLWAALSSMARRGIIARHSDLVESLAQIDTVVFDKTGTLGEEQLELIDFVADPSLDRSLLLEEIAAIQTSSSHPIAASFQRPTRFLPEKTHLLPGIGIAGYVNGAYLEIGNNQLLTADCLPHADSLRRTLRSSNIGTHEVWVKRNGKLVGLGILREKLRLGATQTLRELEDMGLHCIVMTGDRHHAAQIHSFREVYAELKPHEKESLVRNLLHSGKKVLFVGDGINDSPAMAAATTSIAVGESASALARETAHAILPSADLRTLPTAIRLCRKTLRAIRSNLLYAAAYNAIGIALAATGIIHPVIAAILMLLSSFGVTWRALRPARQEEEAQLAQEINQIQDEIVVLSTTQTTPSSPIPSQPRQTRFTSSIQLRPWEWWAILLGIALQGILISWLGNFNIASSAWLIALFLTAAAALFFFARQRPWQPDAAMAAGMFSIGGFAMLLGWFVDAGLAPIVREGVCLCGCPKSSLGWGLLQPNWMLAGMTLGMIPTLRFEPAFRFTNKVLCGFVGFLGMLLGMAAAATIMAQIPVLQQTASFHFFATYAAMVVGMLSGMLIACRILRHLLVK